VVARQGFCQRVPDRDMVRYSCGSCESDGGVEVERAAGWLPVM